MGSEVSLYETKCAHDDHVDHSTQGLSQEMKDFVRQKFTDGVRKPNAILAAICCQNKMKELVKSKVELFSRSLRVEKLGHPTVSAIEIRSWCSQRLAIPTDEDTAYILKYFVHVESSNSGKI